MTTWTPTPMIPLPLRSAGLTGTRAGAGEGGEARSWSGEGHETFPVEDGDAANLD